MAKPMFIFGGDTGVSSPKELKRLRAVAEALNGPSKTPKNIGEGLNAIGEALLYRSAMGKADRMEDEGEESANSVMNPILSALGFGSDETVAKPSNKVATALMGKPDASGEIAATDPSMTPFSQPEFADDGTELGGYLSDATRRSTLPAGMRNNNPGNIKFVGQKVPGIMGPSENTDQGDPQAVFDTPESGMAAMYSLAKRKYDGGKKTPMQLIAGDMGWTPGNTQAAANVARNMGIGPDDDINMTDPAMASRFMQALILQEHGNKGKLYSQDTINRAVGGRPAQVASLDKTAGMPVQPQTAAQAIEQQAPVGGSLSDEVADFKRTPAYAAQFPGQTANGATVQQQPQQMPQTPAQSVQGQPGQQQAQMPQQQPQQAAQTAVPQQSGLSTQQLYNALQNPWINENQKALVLNELERRQQQQQAAQTEQSWRARQQYEQELERSDPQNQLALEKTRMEVEAMKNPVAKPTDDMREFDFAKTQGFEGNFTDWQMQNRKAGAQTTTINTGEGDKFYENLDRKNAETFSMLSDGGMQARARMGQIDRLEGLLQNAPQGAVGAMKQAAGEWGIATDGLSDIQAASALLEKMVPEQRAPGSGPMSDADIKMFRGSLPRIINQPGGNQLIFQTLRGISDYEQQMGMIADAVADREITPAEGRKKIREMKNPLGDYKIPSGPTPNEGWKELSPGVRVRKVN